MNTDRRRGRPVWKLAAVEGWGGETLLDSFDAERRPIAVRNVKEASGNLRRMLSPGRNEELLDDTEAGAALRRRVGAAMTEAMRQEWFTLGMHLGYRYEDSPVCVPDGTAPTPDDTRNYIPTTRHGSRAPHVWLADSRSTQTCSAGVLCRCAGSARRTLRRSCRRRGSSGSPSRSSPSRSRRLCRPTNVASCSCGRMVTSRGGAMISPILAWSSTRFAGSASALA